MTECAVCERIKKKVNVLFEDDKVVVILADTPSSPGHMIVIPKQHAPIVEKVPDPVMQHMFSVANKAGVAVFESIGAHGTNVLIQNGPAAGQKQNHTMLHVVPRFENDGLQLAWKPGEQASEEDLSRIHSTITEHTSSVGIIQKEKEKPIEETPAEEVEEDDWRSRHLKRMP